MAGVMGFIGALVPTLLLSRLALVALKKWNAGYPKILVANIVSLAVATLVGAFGMADGGPLQFELAFTSYALPQTVWLVLDVVRYRRTGTVTIAPWSFKPTNSKSPTLASVVRGRTGRRT